MIERSLFKRPNIKLESGGDVRKDRWIKCANCQKLITDEELKQNLNVCPKCNHHFRLPARARIQLIADEGTFIEHDSDFTAQDPINFSGYMGKVQTAKRISGENEAVVTGVCEIAGKSAALFVMDCNFMMGSMGSVVGDKITRLFEYATKRHMPVVGYTVSGGARMQEGIVSLMQMAKVSGAVHLHDKAGLLYLTMLTDPTTGGVTASFAMLGDIILAEPGALIAFAGPRVIEQTIRRKLPDGFQRAELLLDKGFIDAIVSRGEHKRVISEILSMHERGA